MPFIKDKKRDEVDRDFRFAEDKGDACYAIYKRFVEKFKAEPRWATIHDIYKTKVIDTSWLLEFRNNKKFTNIDILAALHLAWQVFFMKYVMPYEDTKEKENGTI